MLAVRYGAKMRINEWHQVAGNDAVKQRVAFLLDRIHRPRRWRIRSRSWSRRRRWLEVDPGHPILVNYDHRLGFVSRNQIIQNEVLMPLIAPGGFVFTPPMLKI